jgi:hypothetical protein
MGVVFVHVFLWILKSILTIFVCAKFQEKNIKLERDLGFEWMSEKNHPNQTRSRLLSRHVEWGPQHRTQDLVYGFRHVTAEPSKQNTGFVLWFHARQFRATPFFSRVRAVLAE